MNRKKYLTRKQASAYAKLSSTSTIYEWTSIGLLAEYTEKKLVDLDELVALLQFRDQINEQLRGKTIRPWKDAWLNQKEYDNK